MLDDGTLKCWGYAAGGAIGLGDINNRGDEPNEMGDNLPAVNLGTGRRAKAVSAGYAHTCALLDDDTLKCWGPNMGELGLGNHDRVREQRHPADVSSVPTVRTWGAEPERQDRTSAGINTPAPSAGRRHAPGSAGDREGPFYGQLRVWRQTCPAAKREPMEMGDFLPAGAS